MRLAIAIVVLIGCEHAEPQTPRPPTVIAEVPAPPKRTESPPPARLDWPMLVGQPTADATRAIAKFLDVAEDTNFNRLGVEVLPRDGKVDTVFLHVQAEFGTGPVYRGALFRGVDRQMSKAEIVALLGKPDETGGGRNNWIKYLRPEAQIHFAFDDHDAIYMVTLMPADWQPGNP